MASGSSKVSKRTIRERSRTSTSQSAPAQKGLLTSILARPWILAAALLVVTVALTCPLTPHAPEYES